MVRQESVSQKGESLTDRFLTLSEGQDKGIPRGLVWFISVPNLTR